MRVLRGWVEMEGKLNGDEQGWESHLWGRVGMGVIFVAVQVSTDRLIISARCNITGDPRRRRNRHGHGYRRGRSVRPPNGTMALRTPSERGQTVTVAGVDVYNGRVDGAPRGTTSTPPEVRLTATVRPTRDGYLEVLVAWNWHLTVDRKKASGSETFEFTIHWARKTCNADTRLPHCDDPDAYYSNTVWSDSPEVRVGQMLSAGMANGDCDISA